MHDTRSAIKVQGQEDTSCAKIRKIINNSAGMLDFENFCTDFDHVTLDVPRNFQSQWVKGQGHTVI